MADHEDLIRLYTGSEIDVSVLKEVLDDNQIPSIIKNEMDSGKAAGFGGGYAGSEAHILVSENDYENAKVLLGEFLKSFEKE
jgi:putative signal transducing protein